MSREGTEIETETLQKEALRFGLFSAPFFSAVLRLSVLQECERMAQNGKERVLCGYQWREDFCD